MEVVEAGLRQRGVAASQVFIERFDLADEPPAIVEASTTQSVVIKLERRKHKLGYVQGDTILDTVRRAGLQPPFACQAGSCATCMAFLEQGEATMRANNALSAAEVEEGWVLTCQAIPTSPEVVVDYDR
jgi:ferredoxin